jgi:Zn-dependent M28 family amino/carboxypeptidase
MRSIDELDVLDEAVLADLRALASDEMRGRQPGTEGSGRACERIVATLYRLGIAPAGPSHEIPFSWTTDDGRTRYGTNVVGVIPGTARPERVLVVGAHYDHLGVDGADDGGPRRVAPERICNGADDNASGVAALLGIARHFTRQRPESSLVLAFFDGEEDDMRGSRDFVARPPVPLERVAAFINLDMLGRDRGNTLWAVGPHHYPQLRPPIEAVARRAPVRLRVGHDRLGWVPFLSWDWTGMSDQASFHDRDIPFVYFGVANHADTHETSDTIDEIDEEFFLRAFRTVLDAVGELDARAGELLANRD